MPRLEVSWVLAFLPALLALGSDARAQDWRGFRGSDATAQSDTAVPREWNAEKNVRWRLPLPGPGTSSPIVVGDAVFVTCWSGYGLDRKNPGDPTKLRRHLLKIDRRTGQEMWRREVGPVPSEDPFAERMATHGYASSTPVSDGKFVYTFFGKSGVFAYDLDGTLAWSADVGKSSSKWKTGSGTSPSLFQDLLFINACDESQSLIALTKKDGKELWRRTSDALDQAYTMPLVRRRDTDSPVLLFSMLGALWGLDPRTGKNRWTVATKTNGALGPCVIATDAMLYSFGGQTRVRSHAVRLGGRGDVTDTHVAWKSRYGSYVTTPLLFGDHLYWVNEGGIVYCANAKTGELVFQKRFEKSTFYASPVRAGDAIYFVSRESGTFVIAAKPEFERLAHNTIAGDETTFDGTPALSGGEMFLRSREALYCVSSVAAQQGKRDKRAEARAQDEFFGLDKIWDVHIEMSRADWAAMFPGRSKSPTRLFGKFPYRTAKVTIGNETFAKVGIRMKGNATFMANGGTLKKSLKLDFNRETPGQRFRGMGKLNLQCNALDRTQIKEAVSYQIYRNCGVVAGRTAFARVYLTLPGELDRAYVGLYTAVEQVDQRFAKRTVGGGLILKPDGETLEWLGPQWNEVYTSSYHPKSKVTKELSQPLIATAALFDEPDDQVFAAGIEAVMDVDSFLKYTAATTILINTDSPLTVPDNYYLIVSQKTKKVTWVAWDMNWSLGEYGRITNTPTVHLDIFRPTQKAVFRRILEHPRFASRYRAIAKRFIDGPANATAMTKAIQAAHATVKDALAAEAKREKLVTDAPRELGGNKNRHPQLNGREGDNLASILAFAKAREQSVKDQLAGTRKGASARNLWGTNERTVRGRWVRDALASVGAFTQSFDDRTQAVAAAQTGFAALDKDSSGTLTAAELTPPLRKRWREEPRRRRYDPSADRAGRAIAQLDQDGDRSVSKSEWQTGVPAMLRYWDANGDGRWSPRELGIR